MLTTVSSGFLLAHASAQTDATDPSALPNAPQSPVAMRSGQNSSSDLTLIGTPKRIVLDEVHIVTSPAHLQKHDLVWLLPLAGATAASLATDSYTMRHVVSQNSGFNAAGQTSSDVLRGLFIGAPVLLFGEGELVHNQRARDTGLLAGEAMVDAYIASEGIKYITLRERPSQNNAEGHFFNSQAVSDPSFVSGHSIVAWSSAAVLAGQYSKPWQQAGIYTLATGASLSRVLGQQHFPTDVLLGSAAGWLIGRYVYRTHYHARSAAR